MYRAIVDNELVKASRTMTAVCPHCGSAMIAKCGEIKIDHWAHKSKMQCDDWYTGKESEWHYNWKEKLGIDFSEKKIEKSGVYHIADFHLPEGKENDELIIEFQNSPISILDVMKRERFYGPKLIWVLNGTEFDAKFIIDRESSYSLRNLVEYQEYWSFEPEYTFKSEYFNDNYILDQCAFHINVPANRLIPEYREFLIEQGFIEDVHYNELLRKFPNYKGYQITYYKHMPTLITEQMDSFKNDLSEKAMKQITKERKSNSKNYRWKYAKKAFQASKQPVFIDLNDKEIFQIENEFIEGGVGKLFEKEYFINRVYDNIAKYKAKPRLLRAN